jgi:hypothetical protein
MNWRTESMNWLKSRAGERTSLDGAALIACGLVVLFLGPFASWAAYAAVAYGAWTMWKSE